MVCNMKRYAVNLTHREASISYPNDSYVLSITKNRSLLGDREEALKRQSMPVRHRSQ